jgi:hypothetical protein
MNSGGGNVGVIPQPLIPHPLTYPYVRLMPTATNSQFACDGCVLRCVRTDSQHSSPLSFDGHQRNQASPTTQQQIVYNMPGSRLAFAFVSSQQSKYAGTTLKARAYPANASPPPPTPMPTMPYFVPPLMHNSPQSQMVNSYGVPMNTVSMHVFGVYYVCTADESNCHDTCHATVGNAVSTTSRLYVMCVCVNMHLQSLLPTTHNSCAHRRAL